MNNRSGLRPDPRPYFEMLRQVGCPVRRVSPDGEIVDGHRVSRGEDVNRALRNPDLFCFQVRRGAGRPRQRPAADPPADRSARPQVSYRGLLDPFFAPRQMAKLKDDVAALVNRWSTDSSTAAVAIWSATSPSPLPSRSSCGCSGCRSKELDFSCAIKDGIIRGDTETTSAEQDAEARTAAGGTATTTSKPPWTAGPEPGDGLLSDCFTAEVDGVRLTREEIMDICFLMIIAGLDTVTDSLCCFFAHLATHADGPTAHRRGPRRDSGGRRGTVALGFAGERRGPHRGD